MKTQRNPLLATFAIARAAGVVATVVQGDATPSRKRPKLQPPPAEGRAAPQRVVMGRFGLQRADAPLKPQLRLQGRAPAAQRLDAWKWPSRASPTRCACSSHPAARRRHCSRRRPSSRALPVAEGQPAPAAATMCAFFEHAR